MNNYHANKTVLTKITDENILIERYYSSGLLKYKGNLNEIPKELHNKANGTKITPNDYVTKAGGKIGFCSWFDENGQIRAKENYIDGELNGKRITWFDSGQLRSKGNIKNNKFNGRSIFWYKNGQKSSEINYKNGKFNGKFIAWHKNGQIMSKGNYKDNKKDGKWTSWFENGQINTQKVKCY